MIFDHGVIGGGIPGLATAMRLPEICPGSSLILMEKERALGRHQTGHNSGVIHTGIHYPPGSLKAELCRKGAHATEAFCAENGIHFDVFGKLLVATLDAEAQHKEALYDRSKQNEIGGFRISGGELRESEPNIRGLGTLFAPSTGIVALDGEIRLSTHVTDVRETIEAVDIPTTGESWRAKKLIACAGLQSDRLATLAGLEIEHRIAPFRGEHFRLQTARNDIVRHRIYPAPDPAMPFPGVHVTRMIDSSVTVRPNAGPGFAREGYPRLSLHLADMADSAPFPGFWKTMRRPVIMELRNSLWKSRYLDECGQYCPDLTVDDLLRPQAGIRASSRQGRQAHPRSSVRTYRLHASRGQRAAPPGCNIGNSYSLNDL